jgi:hypothetical protein
MAPPHVVRLWTQQRVSGNSSGLISRRRVTASIQVGLRAVGCFELVPSLTARGHADMVARILASLFLSGVALYLAEPKLAPGVRTLIDAVHVRTLVLFALLLVGFLVATRLPQEHAENASTGMACLLLGVVLVCAMTLRSAVGRLRWRRRWRWVGRQVAVEDDVVAVVRPVEP